MCISDGADTEKFNTDMDSFSSAKEKTEDKGKAINRIRSDSILLSKDNKSYQELDLFEKDWKIFAYNEYWENVFLTKCVYRDPEHYNVYFTTINWEKAVAFELSWNTNYYNKNWDTIKEKTRISKIIETIRECSLILLWKNRENVVSLTDQFPK